MIRIITIPEVGTRLKIFFLLVTMRRHILKDSLEGIKKKKKKKVPIPILKQASPQGPN